MNSVADTSTSPAVGGHASAFERRHAARRRWIADGIVLSANDYAARRGISSAVLPALEASGAVFSLRIDGARWYPAELLSLSPDEATQMCRVLAGEDETRQFVFLMRVHGALAGQTVATAVAQGKLAQVLRLAQAWCDS